MSDQKNKPPRSLPLRITKNDETGAYALKLGDLDLSGVVLGDGCRFEFVNDDTVPFPMPKVTLTFAPGALNLDIEAELLGYLRAELDADWGNPQPIEEAGE